MNMMKRYLKIDDPDIRQCILKTNDWYAFGYLLDSQFGNISKYKLWIGKLIWGDNEAIDIFACYKNGDVYFQAGNERHTDLVTFIIHAWDADEQIALHFNNEIWKTIKLLEKNNPYLREVFDEHRFHTPYTFHMGGTI